MNNFTYIYENNIPSEFSLKDVVSIDKIYVNNIEDLINSILKYTYKINQQDIDEIKDIQINESKYDYICALFSKIILNIKLSPDKILLIFKKSAYKTILAAEIIKQMVKEFGFKLDSNKLKVICFKHKNNFLIKITYNNTVIEFYINPKEEHINRITKYE